MDDINDNLTLKEKIQKISNCNYVLILYCHGIGDQYHDPDINFIEKQQAWIESASNSNADIATRPDSADKWWYDVNGFKCVGRQTSYFVADSSQEKVWSSSALCKDYSHDELCQTWTDRVSAAHLSAGCCLVTSYILYLVYLEDVNTLFILITETQWQQSNTELNNPRRDCCFPRQLRSNQK